MADGTEKGFSVQHAKGLSVQHAHHVAEVDKIRAILGVDTPCPVPTSVMLAGGSGRNQAIDLAKARRLIGPASAQPPLLAVHPVSQVPAHDGSRQS